jgi:glucokinase
MNSGGEHNAPTVLAFDIGGTRIKAGIVQGGVVSSFTIEPLDASNGAEGILSSIVCTGQRLTAEREAIAVGISVKGFIDPGRGIILDVNEALSSCIGKPFAQWVAQELHLPTVLENDARMYTLGELLYGAGQAVNNMVCLTLGTGIGCGVALNRRVLRGPRGIAGILGGHITIQVDGPRCTCGNIGCLEALIGTGALLREVTDALAAERRSSLPPDIRSPQSIFVAADAGDALAQEIVQRFAQRLGAGIVSLIHAHDPELVVLGGGMAGSASQFLPAVQAYVAAHTWTLPNWQIQVTTAQLRDSAALVGAAAFACGLDIFL